MMQGGDTMTAPAGIRVTCGNGCERVVYAFGVCERCRNADDFEPPLSWSERVDELRTLGYQDWEIAKKLGNSPCTFVRQADKYCRTVDPLMREMARAEKLARGWAV